MPTASDYRKFHQWLLSRGRVTGTADLYVHHVAAAFDNYESPAQRVAATSLAPKTRLAALSALLAWARWKDDRTLEKVLRDLKKPRDARESERPPLTDQEREAFEKTIAKTANSSLAWAVVALMARRGFRVSDVLRLTRTQVQAAIRENVLRFKAKGSIMLRAPTKRFKHILGYLLSVPKWQTVAEGISPTATNPMVAARAQVSRLVKDMAVQSGMAPEEMYPHRLRRTYAVRYLAAASGDLTKLKAHMGWTSIATAALYSDWYSDQALEEIADKMA